MMIVVVTVIVGTPSQVDERAIYIDQKMPPEALSTPSPEPAQFLFVNA